MTEHPMWTEYKNLPHRVRRLLPVAVILVAALSLGLCSRGPDRIGSNYASLEELEQAQQQDGYAKVGTFGKDWPARIVEVARSRDRLTFARQDGTRHSYNGFEGHTLKMIRLQGRHSEVIIVFRSNPEQMTNKSPIPAGGGEIPVRVL
jgi:hypothetical protein